MRLRSRFESCGRSQTSPNSTSSVSWASFGAKSPMVFWAILVIGFSCAPRSTPPPGDRKARLTATHSPGSLVRNQTHHVRRCAHSWPRGAATGSTRHARLRTSTRAPLSRRHHVQVIAVASSIRRPRVTGREVGRVAALWRYPVKSMAPEALERVEVGWHGVAGDRRWAFVRAGQERSGFPWLTIREHPELAHYQPRLVEPASPDKTAVRIRTPDGI